MDKQNISRDEIAEAMKNEFGFNRKQCLDIVNDIIDIIIEIQQLANINLEIIIFSKYKPRTVIMLNKNPRLAAPIAYFK